MENNNDIIGNVSSLVKTVSMLIAGAIIGYLANNGLNLGVPTETLSEVIGAIIFLALAYIDMKYPNTMIRGKTQQKIDSNPEVLNDEYECDEDGC